MVELRIVEGSRGSLRRTAEVGVSTGFWRAGAGRRAPCLFGGPPHTDDGPMRGRTEPRSSVLRYTLAVCGTLALAGCASKYAQVPPRLDLRPHRQVALVTFTSADEHRGMGELATRRFAEA